MKSLRWFMLGWTSVMCLLNIAALTGRPPLVRSVPFLVFWFALLLFWSVLIARVDAKGGE